MLLSPVEHLRTNHSLGLTLCHRDPLVLGNMNSVNTTVHVPDEFIQTAIWTTPFCGVLDLKFICNDDNNTEKTNNLNIFVACDLCVEMQHAAT